MEISFVLENLKKWMEPKKVITHSLALMTGSIYYQKIPYGAVLIISPWNYPFSLLVRPLIGALAGGNVCCLKPSEITSNTSTIIAQLFPKYFSEEIITVVEGSVKETQDLLNQRWDKIFFTGSTTVGKIVMEKASKFLIPICLELGGKAPVVVHKDASLSVAARRITWGKFLNVGQSCIAPDYILVHKDVKEKFITGVKSMIEEFFTKTPKESKEYGRIINKMHFNRLKK